MDFSLSSDHTTIADLARQIFRDQVSDSYLADSPSNPDTALWKVLGEAGLIGLSLSEAAGGSGMDFIAECLVLQEMGHVLAPVPLRETLLAAWALDQAGQHEVLRDVVAGDTYLALNLGDGPAHIDGLLSGTLPHVPYAEGAARVVTVAGEQLVAFDPSESGVSVTQERTTSGRPAATLQLQNVAVTPLGDAELTRCLKQRLQIATAALQLGVAEEALQRTAAYTTERKQFNKPIAAFQAVSHRAANGYIDIEALRAVLDGAMWRISAGLDATLQAGATRWWACEMSHRVSHTAQHLHGGIGADLEYPIHRYFLWAKQLEFDLGGAGQQLAAMGEHLAQTPGSGITL
ncbi:MAG: acyl-CoA dehydrogenase [Haliea sp.]|nr:acyl-CoA dehydrogenase [Haliea sp.]|tara:strand:+ start:1120 stop:2160 length:1041 start_codon:yes stop_codon:yes gene_type:complete